MGHLVTLLQNKRIIVQDGFNRADNALTMGNANTGQAWTSLIGTWGILSQKAYLVSSTAESGAVVDAGIGNIILDCDITLSPTASRADAGVIFRTIDSSNYLMAKLGKHSGADSIELYKRDLGTFTLLAIVNSAGNINGVTYGFKVIVNGSNISIYRDGALKISQVLAGADATKYATATKSGIRVNFGASTDDGGSRFDNFRVEAI